MTRGSRWQAAGAILHYDPSAPIAPQDQSFVKRTPTKTSLPSQGRHPRLHRRAARARPASARSRAPSAEERRPRRLKRMLRELADEGTVESRRKKLHHAGALPSVALADITGRDTRRRADRDPDRMGRGRARRGAEIRIARRRARRGPAKSPASATARCCASRRPASDGERSAYTGRVIKIIDRAKQRVLGIFRALPGGGGRLVPVDKKQLGTELAIPPGATDGRAGRRPGRGRASQRRAASACPSARVEERLGSLKSERAVSLIAIHAHGIPHVFPRDGAGRSRGGAARRRSTAARTGASCRSSPSIRPTPRTTTTRSTPRPTPTRPIPAATSSPSRSPTSRITCGRARRSTARR